MSTELEEKADAVPDFNWLRDSGWIIAKINNAKLEKELLLLFRAHLLAGYPSGISDADQFIMFGSQIDFLEDMSELKHMYSALDVSIYIFIYMYRDHT